MKAPDFGYVKPTRLDQALDLLASHGAAAVPLAGGQSLVATLNLRLSAPEILVDISDLDELKGIRMEEGTVSIGAGTVHADIASSPLVRRHLPLVTEAMRHVAHVAIRNRGTIGGSLAYADPAAEMPACGVALGATFVLASAKGQRLVPACDFYKGLFETDLAAGELLTEVRFPQQNRQENWGFSELARRHGDFALAGLAAITRQDGNTVATARLAYFGCTDYAKLARRVAAKLCGEPLPLAESEWLPEALALDLAPTDSPGLRAATKIKLAATLTRRTLQNMRALAAD
jgi:aerobic carbon-monoxide dehydrogenase medium subunit